MGTEIDKASGVKATPTAKKGKKVIPPKHIVQQDLALQELCALQDKVVELESEVNRLDDIIINGNKTVNKLNKDKETLTSDNKALVKELERSDGIMIDNDRKIRQLLDKNDMLKDDIINITKSFCLIK